MAPAARRASGQGAAHIRTKVTLACDSCRRRRVKCSGEAPCSSCAADGETCIYDEKSRGRRGPRPRRQKENIIHAIAPALPSGVEPCVIQPVGIISPKTTQPPRPRAGSPSPYIDAGSEIDGENAIGHLNSDGEAHGGLASTGSQSPDWRSGVSDIVTSATTSSNFKLDDNLAAHLINLFYRRSNIHLTQVIPASKLSEMIASRTASHGLVCAITACAVRYSLHPRTIHKSSRNDTPLDETLSNIARESTYDWPDSPRPLEILWTFCALLDYEIAKTYGRRAWATLSMSKTLVHLHRQERQLTPEQMESLEKVEYYLQLTEAVISLGQSTFQSALSNHDITWNHSGSEFTSDGPAKQLLQQLRLLVRVTHYSSVYSSTAQDIQAWDLNSEFRSLHAELEEYVLQHPCTPSLEKDDPFSKDEVDGTFMEALSSMVCHCSDIVLNMKFLPIPEPRGKHQDHAPKCIDYPCAPPLFVLERVHRCEASAEAICRITRDMIQNDIFFSHLPLLGYCATHAILVFLNQLHRQSKPQQSTRVIEDLKSLFVVLAAVKRFHSPAATWLDIIFRAHDMSTPLTHHKAPLEEAFRSYLSRFCDVGELCYIPVASTTSLESGKMSESPSTNPATGSITVLQKPNENQDKEQPEWIRNYSGHLSQDVDMTMEGEEQVTPGVSESQGEVYTFQGMNGVGIGNQSATTSEELMSVELGMSNLCGLYPPTEMPWMTGAEAGEFEPHSSTLFADLMAIGGLPFESETMISSDPVFGVRGDSGLDWWPRLPSVLQGEDKRV